MKIAAPLAKSIRLLVVLAFVTAMISPGIEAAYGQKRAKRTSPKSTSRAAGIVEEGEKLLDDSKWPEAIDVFKLAIRLDPKYAPAYGGLGYAYMSSGNADQAIDAYKEQVRLTPNDAQAQHDLGFAYNAMGRHGEAFAPLVKATALDPNFAEAYYGIAYAYLRGDDFEKSVGYFKSAIRLQPDYADAYHGLALAYARQGKVEAANEQVKKLATIDPKLARRAEKEVQSTGGNAVNTDGYKVVASSPPTSSAATSAPAVTTTKPQPESAVQKPAAPMATEQAASQTATALQKTDAPAQQDEPVSRQLQQLPPPAPATVSSQPAAAPVVSVTPQEPVKALPVSAKRWALIIGVDKYTDPQISPLKGSDNDARLIADALVRYAGFPQDQVILLSTNQPLERQPTRVNILRRLSNLSTTVPKDGLLLVSFAGHGMEREGQAFLLPSDAQISDQISFLEETAISINRVKERIKQTGVAQVVVLLDACRNDPGGRADAPNNLTNVYTSAFSFDVRNREVQAFATVYATGIGQRAYEYTEKKQGYFSWAVVEGLKGSAANEKGEITLSQLVKYVQDNVPKRIAIDLGSTKQQRPFAIIEGYRADELVVAVTNSASMANNTETPNISVVDPAAIELAYWDTIKNSNNPDDFKAYLDKYPDGQFAALAKSRAQPARSGGNPGYADSSSLEMTYWNAIKDSKNPSDIRAYVTKFPNGLFVDLANSRIASLEAEAREKEGARIAAEEDNRIRNTRIFDVNDAGRTEGSLTVAPGVLSFEVKKRSEKNDRKNMTIQCSEIRRIEAGKSVYQPPHVNLYLHPVDKKERLVVFWTSRGGQGIFINTPVVDVTPNVIEAVINACKMARVN